MYNLHYDDVRGDFLRPSHGTTAATVELNKNQKGLPLEPCLRKLTCGVPRLIWLIRPDGKKLYCFNPDKLNGLSHSCTLSVSICHLRGNGDFCCCLLFSFLFFSFFSFFFLFAIEIPGWAQ